jgi:hypothetical protein
MKKMAYDRLMTARIKNLALTVVMILACGLLMYKYGHAARNPGAPAFDAITIMWFALLLVLTVVVLSIQRFVASIDDEKFATYTRVAWARIGLRTFDKTSREFVMIEQDKDHFYCLTIKTRDGDIIVLERYPTLDHATGPLQQLKKIVT